MNIRPLYDRIVVKRIEDSAEKTASGLFIPDSAKEKPQEGEVIAVGPGARNEDGKIQALDVKAGDRILLIELSFEGNAGPCYALTTWEDYQSLRGSSDA